MNRELFLWPGYGFAILIGAALNWWMFAVGVVGLAICVVVLLRANPRGKATYADLVDAETRCFAAEEREWEALELIRDLAEGEFKEPCDFDHHGYCQAHGWFETEPGCPIPRARALLERIGAS